MHKPFRFKYANEFVGGFVLLAIFLLMGGIFLAGRSKGWFEGKFEMYTTFDIKEGSQGLREGNEVVILDASAGRVSEVLPDADGNIRATFIINNRYRQYIRKDSVAKVKKKFVAAGDAFIEIEVGTGDPVRDGDFIECVKDEELMESLQRSMKKIEEVFVPMLKEVEDILKNVNSILESIDKGKGTMGAIVNDEKLAMDVKAAVTNANSMIAEIKGSFEEATALMSDTRDTISNITTMAKSATGTSDEIKELAVDAQDTFGEATRLIKGAQKVWLWKKHVKHDEAVEFLPMMNYTGSEVEMLESEFRAILQEARKVDNTEEIVRGAYNMAVIHASNGRCDEAETYATEVRSISSKRAEFCGKLLSAYTTDCKGKPDEAMGILESIRSESRDHGDYLRIQYHLLFADLHSRMNNPDEAREELDDVKSRLRKTSHVMLKAVDAWISARIYMMEENPAAASGEYDRASRELQYIGSYERMAEALRNAGLAYAKAGDKTTAADRCYRAGRGYYYIGQKGPAKDTLSKAERFAEKSGSENLLLQIKQFSKLIK